MDDAAARSIDNLEDLWRSLVELCDRLDEDEWKRDGEVADETWTVRLLMPATTFAALVGGRSDVPDDVRIDGDHELGRRIVDHLGFMP